MNPLTVIQDATACLRQFHASPAGICSAVDIAAAEGIPLERCADVLARLEEAHLVESMRIAHEAHYRLVDAVTALEVLNAVWAPRAADVFIPLYASAPRAGEFLKACIRGQWAQG